MAACEHQPARWLRQTRPAQSEGARHTRSHASRAVHRLRHTLRNLEVGSPSATVARVAHVVERTAHCCLRGTRAGRHVKQPQGAVFANDRCLSLKVWTPLNMRGAHLRSRCASDAAHFNRLESSRSDARAPKDFYRFLVGSYSAEFAPASNRML